MTSNAAATTAALQALLRCPHDGAELSRDGGWLVGTCGHRHPVVDDIPVLLRDDQEDTLWVASASRRHAERALAGERSDPFATDTVGLTSTQRAALRDRTQHGDWRAVVAALISATNGILYEHRVDGRFEPPIPDIPLPAATGRDDWLLDLGCNWGRWCMAAARKGYRCVGIDPSLGALLAAKQLAESLGVGDRCAWVVADARWLPFAEASFSTVYSYSVLQHFARPAAQQAIAEAARVLRPGGTAKIQLANRIGLRSLYHQWRRRGQAPQDFEVRYWSTAEMRRVFGAAFGRVALSADGYFGLGMRPEDAAFLGGWRGAAARSSGVIVRVSDWLSPLVELADSVFVAASDPRRSATAGGAA